MNILVELVTTQFNPRIKFSGGNEYLKTIFNQIKNYNNIYFLISKKLKVPDELNEELKDKKVLYLENDLEEQIRKCKIKKFYISGIHNFVGISFPKELEIIVTIHDLRPFEIVYDNTMFFYKLNYQHFLYGSIYRICSNNFYLEELIKGVRKKLYFNKFKNIYEHKNKKIITVSRHSKQMLLLNFKSFISEKQIEVCYSPEKIVKNALNKNQVDKDTFYLERDFYLILSADRLEKNAFRAIKAIDELISKKLIFRKTIVLGELKSNILKKIKNKEWFINIDYVSSAKLETLYQKCYALIYPTISEGFGYPPLEAMKYKKPVLVSAITSLTEILGSAPVYFNPFSIEEIQVRILELESIYNKKVEVAYKKYQEVSLKQKADLKKVIEIITKE